MPKSKASRKKYSPRHVQLRRRERMAAKCLAYQWEEAGEDAGLTFNCAGPYSQEQNIELIEWAFGRKNRWILTAVACFVDNAGDYYEDMVTITTECAFNFLEQQDVLRDHKDLAGNAAKREGNPLHWVTTTYALSLQSTDLTRKMENDTWLKQQADHRAQYVLSRANALRASDDK